MADKIKWPEEVTMVEAKDICRHSYISGAMHCSLGWFEADTDAEGVCTLTENRWTKEYIKQAGLFGVHVAARGVTEINDDESNPLTLIARIINRTWAALGYVVNNPECYKNGKLKPIKR